MNEILRAQQFALARYVRGKADSALPADVDPVRMAVYRELFFNANERLLAGSFPVIVQTLGDPAWRALVGRFYADYRCKSPLFTQVAREFVQYLALAEASDASADTPPWLAELAHYEWIELMLQIADDALPPHDHAGDLLAGRPIRSPHAVPLSYRWPVHRIGPAYRPAIPPGTPTLLLVQRDRSGDVSFSLLTPLVYRLLDLIDDGTIETGSAALRVLAAEAGIDGAPEFMREGVAMLEQLRGNEIILGTSIGVHVA